MINNSCFQHWELLQDLCLDENIKANAEELYLKFKAISEEIEESKSLVVMRCCALIASMTLKMQTVSGSDLIGGQISISNFLRGSAFELNTSLNCLEELLKILPQDHEIIIQKLIRKTEISVITYKKFKDIWEKIDLQGPENFTQNMMQALWMMVIYLKNSLKIDAIHESGYVLISVFNTALKSQDLESVKLSQPYIKDLCTLLKANIDQAESWVSKTESFLFESLQKGDLISKTHDIEGIFSFSSLSKNISMLSNHYQKSLTQDDFDERDLVYLKQKIRTPQKARCLRLHKPHEIIGKVLRWDESSIGPSIASKLHEVKLPPPSPFIAPATPMSISMELNNWFVDLLEIIEEPLEKLQNRIPEYALHTFKLRTLDFLQSTTQIFVQRNVGIRSNEGFQFINYHFECQENFAIKAIQDKNSRTEELAKLYYIVISKILIREIEKQNNVERLVMNEDFLRGIYACCLETVLYLNNVVSINFEEVLEIAGVTPFDFWKVINAFSQFDTNIPHSLRRHFRDIEIKIIANLSWKAGSRMDLAIKGLISKGEDSSDTNLFLRRLLSHSANRILELCNSLSLAEPIKEEIWAAFKYLLSEKTELLINHHLDHMIICTMYGVCKLNSSITFKKLIESHRQLYFEEPDFFKKVHLEGEVFGDIITYYNTTYVKAMKEFLTHTVTMTKPRIEALYPASPIRASVPSQNIMPAVLTSMIKSPTKSPFRTPRSEILWAPNETFSPLPKLNVNKKISFGEPVKKAKIISDLLSEQHELGPAPSLKKEISESSSAIEKN